VPKKGTLVTMLAAEAESVGSFAGSAFASPLMALGTLVSVIAFILASQPWLGMLALAVVVPQAAIVVARLLPPVGIVIGAYLLWEGADGPGGAFQGGALLAAMWILAMMAGLVAAPTVASHWLRLAVVGGPALFLAIGLAGFVIADAFLAYPVTWAKPLIIVIEVALVLSIAATLGLLAAGPPERAPPR
jgi:hypothetical protein